MGHREQKERERKRAGAISQSLERYLPPKKTTGGNDGAAAGSESISGTSVASTSVVLTASTQQNLPDCTAYLPERPSFVSAVAPLPPCSSSTEDRSHDDPESCRQQTGRGCTPMDIGDVFRQAKSSGEFCNAVQTLTAAQKYALLTNHKKPHKDHVFPTQRLQSFFPACEVVKITPGWITVRRWMVHCLCYFLCTPFIGKVCN